MNEISDKKKIVENIRKEIEASKNTHIWSDYVNALKLISQVVFTRSSGFILELIQNAEDAGLGMENTGVFEIRLNQDRVKIVHNGRPFSDNDVKAICGIRSSKKPERGTLGYLGIGFKSVFKITDCPEVYSNGFLFKFDRNHADWDDPTNTPWHVIPIWIDKPSEVIDVPKTTFIIPYREKTYYSSLLEEIRRLRTELYLFLRWLKKIEIIDEVTEQRWMLENVTESEDGITTLRHDSKEQRFKFFHRTIEVPDSVKQDRLTQEYRANVTKREIAVAFALDEEGNLAPSEAGAMYGGVYSFLPLGEARSGAKFPIQADFLVQPGRDAINYEAKWNHWIVEEVTTLCKEAIDFFKKHEKWRYQFLPAFEFTKSKGLESYDILFGPKLVEPVEKFLKDDECVPTIDGGWEKPHMVVRLTEDQKSISDLETMGVVKKDEITYVMGGESGLKIVAAGTKECKCHPIREVGRLDILKNKTFLERNCQEPDAVEWFRALYNWLYKNPIRIITSYYTEYRVNQEEYDRKWRGEDGRTYRERRERYDDFEFILAADMRLFKGGNVTLLDLVPSDPILKELADTVQKSRSVLNPDLLAGTKSEEEQKAIKGFLTGYTGVQVIDSAKVCKDSLLPKILTNAPKPLPEDLLKYPQKNLEKQD